MFSNFIAIRVNIETIHGSLLQARYSFLNPTLLNPTLLNPTLLNPTLLDDRAVFCLHPPSEASGRVGNRAYSEIAGEGWRGRFFFNQCGRPSPATLSLADPPQTSFGEGEDVGDQREVFILPTKIPE